MGLLFMARIKIIGIYKIISPSGKIYIGQSRDLDKRLKSYKCGSSKTKGQPKLYNSFEKYGILTHEFEIIEECDFELLNIRERYWQDFYDVCGDGGLNCSLTETNVLPRLVRQETKEKMSLIRKEMMSKLTKDPNYMAKMKANGIKRRGVPLAKKTEEQKELGRKIATAQGSFKGDKNPWYGKPRYNEENPMFGRKHKQESKLKMSQKAKGRRHGDAAKKKMSETRSYGGNCHAKLVLNFETGIYYDCGKEAWETLHGCAHSTFRQNLNGNVKKNRFAMEYV